MCSRLGSLNFEHFLNNADFHSWYFIKGLQIQDLDPRIKQMYEGVRDVLSKYRSGKLPKAFKIIPNLCNWEQVLYVTGMEYLHFSEVWRTTGLSSTVGVFLFVTYNTRSNILECSCHVPGNSDIHIKSQRENGSTILQPSSSSTSKRWYCWVQTAQLPFISGPKEGSLQTWGIYERLPVTIMWGKFTISYTFWDSKNQKIQHI